MLHSLPVMKNCLGNQLQSQVTKLKNKILQKSSEMKTTMLFKEWDIAKVAVREVVVY